jgi:hypothetical protein
MKLYSKFILIQINQLNPSTTHESKFNVQINIYSTLNHEPTFNIELAITTLKINLQFNANYQTKNTYEFKSNNV